MPGRMDDVRSIGRQPAAPHVAPLAPRASLATLALLASLVVAPVACAPAAPAARSGTAAAASAAAASAAAAPAAPAAAPAVADAPVSLLLDKRALRARGGAGLVARLEASPYRYFRILASEFEARTSRAFRDLRFELPVIAVHGDAHLEQFVVTHDTFGLEDFDHAGYGPVVVDLVRYATSIHLACEGARFACDPGKATDVFLAQYRASVDHAPSGAAPPSMVARLRKKAPQDRAAWLAWVDKQMTALPPADDASTRRSWAAFRDLQRTVLPERPAEFYDVVRVGALRMGVGSALEQKLLFRIRGPSADPVDDVVLEARAGDLRPPTDFVWRPPHGDFMHVLLFTAIIGRRMPDVIGFVSFERAPDKRPFWVQSWNRGYVELSVSDLESQAELEELVSDAARQLGGHFWTSYPLPLRAYQRFAQLQAFDVARDRVVSLSRELSREVVAEHARFRAQPAE